jgi:hypothetical protein
LRYAVVGLPVNRRSLQSAAAVIIALPLVLYLFLLTLQVYSAWEASRTIDRLEALRLGASPANFDNAVRLCKSEYGTYSLTAGGYRWSSFYDRLWNISPMLANGLSDFLNLAGLRYWRLNAVDAVENGQIRSLSMGLIAQGRKATLGAGWRMAPTIPEVLLRHVANKSIVSYAHWFAIDANPGGEGYTIDYTQQSPARDLAARTINRSCLMPFHDCNTLYELLPNLHEFLQEHDAPRP